MRDVQVGPSESGLGSLGRGQLEPGRCGGPATGRAQALDAVGAGASDSDASVDRSVTSRRLAGPGRRERRWAGWPRRGAGMVSR